MGILRAKNMLAIIAVGYAALSIVALASELSHIRDVTADVRNTMNIAAESALSQVVASDEFFANPAGADPNIGTNLLYETEGVTTVLCNTDIDGVGATTCRYEPWNIFQLVYGYDPDPSSIIKLNEDKLKLYRTIYYSNNGETALNNEDWLNAVCQIRFDFMGHSVPQIARIGLLQGYTVDSAGTLIPSSDSSTAVLNPQRAQQFYNILTSGDCDLNIIPKYDPNKQGAYAWDTDWLGLHTLQKSTGDRDDNTVPQYFLAPTNVGITYIDPVLLETAFVCDMSLLMHSAYLVEESAGQKIKTLDINIEDGYVYGIPDSGFHGTAQTLADEALAEVVDQNIINNGTFAFVKGRCKKDASLGTYSADNVNTIGGFTGGEVQEIVSPGGVTSGTTEKVLPRVRYQVIDMTEPANMPLMCAAIGVDFRADDVSSYKDWLVAIGIDPDEPHYCVVAEITFYADVIIPYKSKVAREYYSMLQRDSGVTPAENCFFQVPNVNEDTDSGYLSMITGNKLYEYTTYYAMIP